MTELLGISLGHISHRNIQGTRIADQEVHASLDADALIL